MIKIAPTDEKTAHDWSVSSAYVRTTNTLHPGAAAIDGLTLVPGATLVDNPAITYLSATIDGTVMGVSMSYASEPGVYRIRVVRLKDSDVWIDTGVALLKACIAQAKKEKCTTIWNVVVPFRLPMYTDLDFEIGDYFPAGDTYFVTKENL